MLKITKQKQAIQQYWQKSTYKKKVKSRFQQQVQNIVVNHKIQDNLILVLDKSTALIISNLFKIPQLVAMKITFIQRIQVHRKRLQYQALYFIMPTQNNIQSLINDFKDKQKPQYKKIHIMFPTFTDISIIKKIAGQKNLLRLIAKHSIKQFYHSCRLIEQNTINFQIQYLKYCYSKDNEQQLSRRVMISKKIVEILANLGKLNTVRIYYKKQANQVSQRLAYQVAKRTKKYLGSLMEKGSYIASRQATDVTFLFLDRSVDTVTPLLHNYNYESLLFDFMKISFQGKDDLSDKQYYSFQELDNQVYQYFRYKHISVAYEEIPNQIKKYNGKLQKIQQGQIDFKQLQIKLKNLRTHFDLITAILKKFQQKKMQQVGQLQQSLATGVKQDGNQTSSVTIYGQVLQTIKQPFLTQEQKLRLGLLVLACIKLSKNDYQQLIKCYSQDDQKALKNIIALGISYDATIGKSTKAISKQQQNIALKRMKQTGMPLDRYTTILQLVVPMVINVLDSRTQQQGLDKQIFGSTDVMLFPQDYPQFDNKKFVFCMFGGLSLAQIAGLKSRKQCQNLIIATDHLLDPISYLKNLKDINILLKQK